MAGRRQPQGWELEQTRYGAGGGSPNMACVIRYLVVPPHFSLMLFKRNNRIAAKRITDRVLIASLVGPRGPKIRLVMTYLPNQWPQHFLDCKDLIFDLVCGNYETD